MSNNQPIGIFDSGVGGLSVLVEIKARLPYESSVFLADQAHNPYGQKSKRELKNLSVRITRFLLKRDIKALVIACNTATCYALDYLRSRFKIPIIGVVPAVKPAVTLTKNGKIAIMSTPATAKSRYLDSLVLDFADHLDVLKLGCDGLEESIEYLKRDNIEKLLDKYAKRIRNFGADTVVLGCTHFPFFKVDIKKRLNPKVKMIDSGAAIAKRVEFILRKEKMQATKQARDLYFTTADPKKFSEVATKLLNYKVVGMPARI
ncbi:glutamate racemase [Candidatus Curtissbacteria bacterium]|nr:glutamate racemase [Candidatus Curtissbacteria bacterium]